eukprot:507306-Rhodomonas_salina.2
MIDLELRVRVVPPTSNSRPAMEAGTRHRILSSHGHTPRWKSRVVQYSVSTGCHDGVVRA